MYPTCSLVRMNSLLSGPVIALTTAKETEVARSARQLAVKSLVAWTVCVSGDGAAVMIFLSAVTSRSGDYNPSDQRKVGEHEPNEKRPGEPSGPLFGFGLRRGRQHPFGKGEERGLDPALRREDPERLDDQRREAEQGPGGGGVDQPPRLRGLHDGLPEAGGGLHPFAGLQDLEGLQQRHLHPHLFTDPPAGE